MNRTLYFLKDKFDESSNSNLLWEGARKIAEEGRIGVSNVIVHDTTLDCLPDCVNPNSYVWARFGDDYEEMKRGLPVLEHFERLGAIPINSSASIKRSASKVASSKFAQKICLLHPQTFYDIREVDFFPCVVKADISKGGDGVKIAYDENELKKVVEELKSFNQPLIFQEFVPSNPTKDLRVFVVKNIFTGKWSAPFYYERLAAKGEFRANIFSGGK